MRRLLRASVLLILAAAPARSALALPITGTLHTTGDVTITPTETIFDCSAAGPLPCPAGFGNFLTDAAQTGSFLAYANQSGFIHSLSAATSPLNVPFFLLNFLVLPASLPADIAFDLSFINPGVSGQAQCAAAPAIGQTCTPVFPALVTPANVLGLSMLNFVNTAAGSEAWFSVFAEGRRVSTGEITPFEGTFTILFPGMSYQGLLSVLSSGGAIRSSYSATFESATAPVPEPASLMLLGLGLGASVLGRRRRH